MKIIDKMANVSGKNIKNQMADKVQKKKKLTR